MSKTIWTYVLAHDTGFAPCIDNGILSLACCKPLIRRNAQVGDYIFGFMPKKLTGFQLGRLSWMGIVSEIMPLAHYMKNYKSRSDAIYNLSDVNPDGSFNLIHNGSKIHADQKNQNRDIFGRNAVICDPFWYWGRSGIFPPNKITDKLIHYRQGHKRLSNSEELISDIIEWSSALSPGVHDSPRDAF